MGFKNFKCTIHDNVLTPDFLAAHNLLLPDIYLCPETMADLAIKLVVSNLQKNKDDKVALKNEILVMLPFDCMLEAEALGAAVVGYDDLLGLRGSGTFCTDLEGLAALPNFDFSQGRVAVVLRASHLVAARGYIPCLNVSGFFAITQLLIGTEKLLLGWRQQRQLLLDFFWILRPRLVAYVEAALLAGCKIISFADPIVDAKLIGPVMAKEVMELLVLPFFQDLQMLNLGGVVHLCGVNSQSFDTLAGVETETLRLSKPLDYKGVMVNFAKNTCTPAFLGFGCLNHNKLVKEIYKFKF